jgi:ATPase subunit of ABC transporter with duplicated ATPase domains
MAGERMLAAERELAAGAEPAGAGMRLGEAIGEWSELGGYELEGRWDAACRRIVRAGLDEVGPRLTSELSGGERKRLVLEVLFSSDASVLLLDEPDNFLDVPAKLELERRIAASKKTVVRCATSRSTGWCGRPTDNLDIDSSEALEAALESFVGTVVAVSHDRAFLRRLDRFLLLAHDGAVYALPDTESALEALAAPEDAASARLAKPLGAGRA